MKKQEEQFARSLPENLVRLKNLFGDTMDYLPRTFRVGETMAALITIDGLTNKQTVAQSILQPILAAPVLQLTGQEKLCLYPRPCPGRRGTEGNHQFANGPRAAHGAALPCSLWMARHLFWRSGLCQGFPLRGVDEPSNEVMQRGSREGFIESLQMNAAMIRAPAAAAEVTV